MPDTARSSSLTTNSSPAAPAAEPAPVSVSAGPASAGSASAGSASAGSASVLVTAASVIANEGIQFGGESFTHHHHGTGPGFLVVEAEDLGVGLVELAEQV